MDFKLVEKPEWAPLATFIPNKDEPLYNWFYYKEGFAKELVFRLAEAFSLKKGMRVLDPFCGVGTTLLACKQMGLDSLGFDVHPVAVFAAKVKVRDYDPDKLRQEIKALIKAKFRLPKVPSAGLARRFFHPRTLEDALFFRNLILENRDRISRDFLLLGLMNVAIKCSYAYKDGAVVKVRKKPVPPLRDMLRRQLFRMAGDIERLKVEKCETHASFGDARSLPIESESVDCVITSPPYLNKIEYTKIYEIEHELFLNFLEERPAVRSYIGLSLGKLEKDMIRLEKILDYETVKSLPTEAIPYLMDMFQSIEEMHRVCRKGAKLGIVVGNGCFPTGVVDSDTLLSSMAESMGFKVDKILVLNKRWCTKNRVEKVGIARESLLLWEK
jgi:DNA modification methylase